MIDQQFTRYSVICSYTAALLLVSGFDVDGLNTREKI